MNNDWTLSASQEDYLEAVLDLANQKSVARVKDIATTLNVKRSSVTVALRTLGEKGYVNYAPYAVITLTSEGKRIAECIRNRHNVLKKLFMSLLGVEEQSAEASACLMEHGMTPLLTKRMESLAEVLTKDSALLLQLKTEILSHDNDVQPVVAEKSNLIDLNGCTTGDMAVVRKIMGTGAAKKRYLEMGITVGQPIKVVKAAPLDDPIEVQVRNYRLSMRRAEAENILIEMKS